jgi:hypothetical protein
LAVLDALLQVGPLRVELAGKALDGDAIRTGAAVVLPYAVPGAGQGFRFQPWRAAGVPNSTLF